MTRMMVVMMMIVEEAVVLETHQWGMGREVVCR